MKNKKLLLLSFGLLMATQMIISQVPSYVPSNGLVGYWPFNGNANDASGNNLNGTVTGAALTANRFGIANGAYLFNPNTVSKISIQTQAVTGTGLQNNFSILMWVKPNRNINMVSQSTSCPGTAAINLVNQNQNWALAPAESGTNLGTGISIGNNGVIVGEHGTNILVNRVSSAFNKTGFVCVVLTYSNNSVNVYVDGVLANTVSNYCVNAIKGLPSLLELGTTLYSPNFSGVIDDLGVWNRALSQQEITSINSGVNYSDTCNAVSGSLTQGLVGYWPFCGNYPFYVIANTVGRFFDGKTGIGLNSTINFNNNIWHHIVLTHDYNLQQAKLFIDGVLIETLNSSSFSTNSLIDRFVFGGDLNTNTSANATLFGQLDDIGIWNRALTPQEITQLFNQNQCITNITVTDTLIINVGQLSYTNPVSFANNITIYPNPANTQVNISFNTITDLTGGNINIVNSLGQQVATTPITLSGTNTTMSLDTWGGTGLYFVQILNAQGIVVDVKKIILQ
jgi:hypothetical protein